MPRKTIIWLASFPKSGNTWARALIANYLIDRDEPVPINALKQFSVSDAHTPLYTKAAGGALSPGDQAAVLRLRPKVLTAIATNGADRNMVKTHNQNLSLQGLRLIPPELTHAAIHIVRDPRDVALSYARHYGLSPERATSAMANPNLSTGADAALVKQFLGSWSAHVTSWRAERAFPVLTLRYEDMLADTEDALAKMVRHLGLEPERARIEKAVRFSSFDELSTQERAQGFGERSRHNDRFFHSGTAGQWRDGLDPALAARIEADQGKAMRAEGYLS